FPACRPDSTIETVVRPKFGAAVAQAWRQCVSKGLLGHIVSLGKIRHCQSPGYPARGAKAIGNMSGKKGFESRLSRVENRHSPAILRPAGYVITDGNRPFFPVTDGFHPRGGDPLGEELRLG